MKKIVFLFLLLSAVVQAQEDAWVYFADKPDAVYYFANPVEMLSQKALDRRAAQGISPDDKDIPIHQEYINAVTNTPGITVMAKSKWLNALHIRGSIDAINTLTELEFVASVDFANKDLNGTGRAANTATNKSVAKQLDAQADYNYGSAATQIQMLNGHLLHQQNFTGAGMTIAVLDNGFPGTETSPVMQHLYENNLVLGGYNYVADSDNIYSGGNHGSLVLSTMGGYSDGQLVGTAPDASYYLFVTEDVSSENPVEESYWVEAAEAADSLGVDIINTSLGYLIYDNQSYNYTYNDIDGETAFITRGANVAFSRGMFLVTSAGNRGASADPYIGVPADAFNTLTVGAVNAAEEYASFSCTGPTADGRIKPDVMAMGQGSAYSASDGTITTGNGTSFSSPITAGLVACLWQAMPDKTNAELLQIIRQSADRYTTPDVQYGYGIPDFWAAYQMDLATAEVRKETFALYPNPADEVVHVNREVNKDSATITFYNILCQPVLTAKISGENNQVDISSLPSGIYNYMLSSGSSISAQGSIVKL